MSRKHRSTKIKERTHDFHAEAEILSGHLRMPLKQAIEPQTEAQLYPDGGYLSEHSGEFRIEGVLSFKKAYTQVAGNIGKPGHGWVTLTTTVVEGLNVMEVVTADRVVGQIITEHPEEGYVPRISFLGTRFDNLRIAGHPVKLDMNLHSLEKPEGDACHTTHKTLLDRVKKQSGHYQGILEENDLREDLRKEYNQLLTTTVDSQKVECSLVDNISGSFPEDVRIFGHIIKIRDFGVIELAKLTITHEDYNGDGIPESTTVKLTMADLRMGCAIEGDVPVGTTTTNGRSKP